MATDTPDGAVVLPQSKGTGTSSNDDTVSAAAAALLASHSGGEYVKEGMSISNVDRTNNQLDVAKGVCYVEDTATTTVNSRGSGGNAQIQSSSTSGFDTEIPDDQVYCVILPSGVTNLGMDDNTTNSIYVEVDVTGQNSVTVHATGGSAPSGPYVKIGEVDSNTGGATEEHNRAPFSHMEGFTSRYGWGPQGAVHHTAYNDGLSNEEIARFSLQADEKLEVWRLACPKKGGGGEDTGVSIRVRDATNATTLASTNANTISRGNSSALGTSGTGAEVTVEVSNSSGVSVDIAPDWRVAVVRG